MDTNNRSRALYRLFLFAVSLLFALTLAEVIARLMTPEPQNLRFQQDVDELERIKLHEATSIIQNDRELFWRLVPNKTLPSGEWPFFGIIANGQALREDHLIPPRKKRNEMRILFIGDSRTFGYGVAHDKCYVQLVERLLQKQLPGKTVECINAGVPGYSTFQGWRYLTEQGLDLAPDLLVLDFGWNDNSRWDGLSDIEHYDIMKSMTPPSPLDRSRLCQLLWAAKSHHVTDPDLQGSRPRLRSDESLDILKRIKALTDEKDISLIVLFSPTREAIKTDTTREEAPANSIALDLLPVIQRLVDKSGIDSVYLDEGHFAELGHEAVAHAIVEKVQLLLGAKKSSVIGDQ